jgi:hypothetical protein
MKKHIAPGMFLLFLIFIVIQNNSTYGYGSQGTSAAHEYHRYRSPYRYAIVYNNLEEGTNVSPSRRHLVILLDRKAFSKANLRDLFLRLSERFPSPIWMDAFVETSLEDVETPEENDLPRESEIQVDSSEGKSPLAVMQRSPSRRDITIWSPLASSRPYTIALKADGTPSKP